MSKRSGRLDRAWDFDAKSQVTSAPLVADIDGDGRKEIVFGTKNGKLIVLELDASIKWYYDTNDKLSQVEMLFVDQDTASNIGATPALSDVNMDGKTELIFGNELGFVYCLNGNGNLLWKYQIGSPVRGQVLVCDLMGRKEDFIVVGSLDGKLTVLSSDGKKVWFYDTQSSIESSPAFLQTPAGNFVVFGSDDGYINCVDAKGDLKWKFKTGAKVLAEPAFTSLMHDSRNSIVIGSSDNYFYALDDAGELLWKFKTEGAIIAKASVGDINDDGKPEVVFGSCDNKVYCLTHQGDRLWSYETDFWIASEPILEDIDGDGKKEVIAGSYDHNIYVLDAEGSYILDYLPGLSSIVAQTGHYSDIITKEPGKTSGKKIWQFRTDGVVVGAAFVPDTKSVVVSTKPGRVNNVRHVKE